MINVSASGGTWSATVTDQYKANEGLACEQQTPIMYDGMIITVIPKDGGSYRGRLACYSPSDLRNPIWNSAAEERFGLGPYLMIDGHLFVFKDDGELYVYTNKKNLADNDGNVSAFLHLDMDHLGPVDVYVAMQQQKVIMPYLLLHLRKSSLRQLTVMRFVYYLAPTMTHNAYV